MRVDVTPRRAEITPGQQQEISVTIVNTGTVIGGYTLRVLGADPGWVELETDQISLFPEESRTIVATVTPPRGIPAGNRRIAIQVRELTPPQWSTITEIDLIVPPSSVIQLRVDPLAQTAGKRAVYSVLVENTGNTLVKGHLDGDDTESKVSFAFDPERVVLAPGQHAVVDMQARAKRHFIGTPHVRILSLYLDQNAEQDVLGGTDFDVPQAPRDEREVLANATFIQKSVLSRGALSLLGLLLTITVFAIVITIALSRLVGQTTADRDLALQVAAARNATGAAGTSGLAGTVDLLTSGKPVPGVDVSIFSAGNTSTPVATTATNNQGAYRVTDLAAGSYQIDFRGADFVELWYPGATTSADATTITLTPGQQQDGLNVSVGGVPATISGTVVGNDVAAATLFLETVPTGTNATPATGTLLPAVTTPGVVTPPDNGAAVVQTVPIGADGTFSLTNVPSPSVYDLVVTKTGYATSTQMIDVGAGETRTGVIITLAEGDGLISGTITSATGPLGGVTVTATSGQSTANTVSLTDGDIGSFTLRSLPTPATFTIVASESGFATQTLSLSLAAGQKLSGVSITLSQSSGSLNGVVTVLPSNDRAAGVSVTVTNGLLTVQTVTQSTGDIGAWQAGGLPVPGTYTITFSRADLASQTVSVSLDSTGHLTPGSLGALITSEGITVSMQSSTAVVSGTIYQPGGDTVCDTSDGALGEATVTLNSGSSSYTVISASVPADDCGRYVLDAIPPATYTLTVSAGSGTIPTSSVFTVSAGQNLTQNVTLAQPASISGVVQCCTTGSSATPGVRPGWSVFLYVEDQYPQVVAQSTTTVGGDGPTAGTFTFSDIDAGTYIIAAGPTTDPANATNTLEVTVKPSQHVQNVTVEVSQ